MAPLFVDPTVLGSVSSARLGFLSPCLASYSFFSCGRKQGSRPYDLPVSNENSAAHNRHASWGNAREAPGYRSALGFAVACSTITLRVRMKAFL